MPTAYGDNYSVIVLPGAPRTVSATSPRQINQCYPGFILLVELTFIPGAAPALTPSILILNPFTGTWNSIWTAAVALTAVGLYAYCLYPTVAAVPAATYTQEVRLVIPRDWALYIFHGDANSVTYHAVACYVKS